MEKRCTVDGCDNSIKARGVCANHYARRYRTSWYCRTPDCDRESEWRGYCQEHFDAQRSAPCAAEDCDRTSFALGYCKAHWKTHTGPDRICAECGGVYKYRGSRRSFCSDACRKMARRGPVRRAIESGDLGRVVAAARESSTLTAKGCWEWQYAKNPAGYPVIGQGGTGGLVHRHVAFAVAGRAADGNSVHHKCANRACVNPDHLQLISQRENLAEMFERNYYLKRIADLEAALMDVAPSHPLLDTANAAGEYTVTSVTESSTAS